MRVHAISNRWIMWLDAGFCLTLKCVRRCSHDRGDCIGFASMFVSAAGPSMRAFPTEITWARCEARKAVIPLQRGHAIDETDRVSSRRSHIHAPASIGIVSWNSNCSFPSDVARGTGRGWVQWSTGNGPCCSRSCLNPRRQHISTRRRSAARISGLTGAREISCSPARIYIQIMICVIQLRF